MKCTVCVVIIFGRIFCIYPSRIFAELSNYAESTICDSTFCSCRRFVIRRFVFRCFVFRRFVCAPKFSVYGRIRIVGYPAFSNAVFGRTPTIKKGRIIRCIPRNISMTVCRMQNRHPVHGTGTRYRYEKIQVHSFGNIF
jgi:hypothetical protein